jgi:uncharacterized membrane protein YagU involved in acid resistance
MATNTMSAGSSSNITQSVIHGIVGGVIGGVVFGLMMTAQGMMPMVAMLARSESVVIGWVVHLIISAFIGGVFGVVASRLPTSWGITLGAGVVNGVVWWMLGALILMPLMLGMGEMVLQIGDMQINSLIGHVIFGVIAAAVYRWMASRS